MAIWKDSTPAKPATTPNPAPSSETDNAPKPANFDPAPVREVPSSPSPSASSGSRAAEAPLKESVIAADLTIEGKIEGTGHVRIAGRFNGDVNVQGNLTIETGARLSGGVRAHKVIVAGELEGNIESAQRVELLESGALTGDVKAGVLTVASGARMRGQVDFGWSDKDAPAGRGDKGRSGTKPDADA